MFTIRLDFEKNEQLTGLEALDMSRRLKLEDTAALSFVDDDVTGAHSAYCGVSEGFARAYFDRTETESVAVVPIEMLIPGDVAQLDGVRSDNTKRLHYATFADSITPERVRELYVATIVATCDRLRGTQKP